MQNEEGDNKTNRKRTKSALRHVALSPLTAIVPMSYLEARDKGASKGALEKLVNELCLAALARDALKRNQPAPEHVAPELVSLTMEMYEYALAGREQDA